MSTKNTPTQNRDLALIARARNGEEDAVSEILRHYKYLVGSEATEFFLQGGGVDDLIQEGMIGLYHAIWQYDNKRGASFCTFAALCIRRAMLDAVRKASRRRHEPLNQSLSLDMDVSTAADLEQPLSLGDIIKDEAPMPDQAAIAKEQFEDLAVFMHDRLSNLELAVANYLREGMSYREIAQKLGRSEKSIDSAIQRMRHKLRAKMEENPHHD